jgi:glycosyltransferase 2 family protein
LKYFLRLLVSATLLAILLTYFAHAEGVWEALRSLTPGFALLALGTFTLDRILMAFKWTRLLMARGYRVSLADATAIYCTAMTLGTVLPSTVGSDVIRGVLTSRYGVAARDAVSSIVIERLIGFLTVLMLAFAGLLGVRLSGILDARYDDYLLVAALVVAGAAGVVLALLDRRLVAAVLDRLPPRWRKGRFGRELRGLLEAYRELAGERPTLYGFTLLTFLEQLLTLGLMVILAAGMGISISLLMLLAAMPLSLLAARLPITLDGIGVYEATFAGLMSMAGLAPEQSVALALAGRGVQLAGCVPWVLFYVVRSRRARHRAECALTRSR